MLWTEWTAVVNGYAQARRSIKPKMDAEAYKSLHTALMHGFQVKSAIGDEATRMAYHELHSLVSPWVSLGALGQAHRDVIIGLLIGCRELGTSVGLHATATKPSVLHRAGWLISLAALAGAMAWLEATNGAVSRTISSGAYGLPEEADYYLFRPLTTPAGLALAAAVLMPLAIWMVRGLRKI
jgi:hypothetical protein